MASDAIQGGEFEFSLDHFAMHVARGRMAGGARNRQVRVLQREAGLPMFLHSEISGQEALHRMATLAFFRMQGLGEFAFVKVGMAIAAFLETGQYPGSPVLMA